MVRYNGSIGVSIGRRIAGVLRKSGTWRAAGIGWATRLLRDTPGSAGGILGAVGVFGGVWVGAALGQADSPLSPRQDSRTARQAFVSVLDPTGAAQLSRWGQAGQAVLDQALVQELAGDNAQRQAELERILAAQPDHQLARWHRGQLQVGERWLTPAEAAQRAVWDMQLAEYRRLRTQMQSAADEFALAQFCERWDTERARLHYWQVVRREDAAEPLRQSAAEWLGLQQVDGEWLDAEQLDARAAEEAKLRAALEQWLPRWQAYETELQTCRAAQPAAAKVKLARAKERIADELVSWRDPQLALATRLAGPLCSSDLSELLAQALADMESETVGPALAELALWSPDAQVPQIAAGILSKRAWSESVPYLIAKLADPARTQFYVELDGVGTVNYYHSVRHRYYDKEFVDHYVSSAAPSVLATPTRVRGPARSGDADERRRFVQLRALDMEPGNIIKPTALPWLLAADDGELRMELLTAVLARLAQTQLQIARTEQYVADRNQWQAGLNRRVGQVLALVTGQKLSPTLAAWQSWWAGHNEQSSLSSPPTTVRHSYSPQRYYAGEYEVIGMSCFPADTLVWTELGQRAIAEIKPGDRVLSQDVESGKLSYELVERITLRPPTQPLVLETPGSQIQATPGHPFWVAGEGWKMAKELAVGDRLHSLNGSVEILGVTTNDQAVETYNLVVPAHESYFVGPEALLVRDNRIVAPTFQRLPGWK